jgi:hypothetical protein
MNVMKKILPMILVALMAFVMSGCGSSEVSGENPLPQPPQENPVVVSTVQLTFADGTTAKKVPIGVSGDIRAIAIYSNGTTKDITTEVTPVSSNDNVVGIAD